MKSLSNFFLEVYNELKKVQWLEKKEFFFLIVMTFVIITLFSVFFGLVDTFVSYGISKIINFFV